MGMEKGWETLTRLEWGCLCLALLLDGSLLSHFL